MAAPNFVAIEDGLEENPKLLGLAKILGVPRERAFWFVYRLRRLVFVEGDGVSGQLPKTIFAHDVASFLGVKGRSPRLIDALKKQGFLGYRKGRGFYYPSWTDTVTGRYASHREEDRLRKERTRRALAAGNRAADDVQGPSVDASSDAPRTVRGNQAERNESNGQSLPPDPPPAGGASLADERWDWLYGHAPTAQDREYCKRKLASMSEEDWALVKGAYGLLPNPPPALSRKNRRALLWPTDQFLRKGAYLRFRNAIRPARTAPRAPTNPTPAESVDDLARRMEERDAFIREMLRDPEVPEKKKAEARDRWLAEPQNAGRQPPWTAS
jgi:hypothetical protein